MNFKSFDNTKNPKRTRQKNKNKNFNQRLIIRTARIWDAINKKRHTIVTNLEVNQHHDFHISENSLNLRDSTTRSF